MDGRIILIDTRFILYYMRLQEESLSRKQSLDNQWKHCACTNMVFSWTDCKSMSVLVLQSSSCHGDDDCIRLLKFCQVSALGLQFRQKPTTKNERSQCQRRPLLWCSHQHYARTTKPLKLPLNSTTAILTWNEEDPCSALLTHQAVAAALS